MRVKLWFVCLILSQIPCITPAFGGNRPPDYPAAVNVQVTSLFPDTDPIDATDVTWFYPASGYYLNHDQKGSTSDCYTSVLVGEGYASLGITVTDAHTNLITDMFYVTYHSVNFDAGTGMFTFGSPTLNPYNTIPDPGFVPFTVTAVPESTTGIAFLGLSALTRRRRPIAPRRTTG